MRVGKKSQALLAFSRASSCHDYWSLDCSLDWSSLSEHVVGDEYGRTDSFDMVRRA